MTEAEVQYIAKLLENKSDNYKLAYVAAYHAAKGGNVIPPQAFYHFLRTLQEADGVDPSQLKDPSFT
ncbi:hypothetical protein [Desulfovibrio subterraneus]|uniref:TAP-C domain-containing protein n=1 Tax=Desulfovibrio subterraneus TaxID=2718620 RepID=A0A7J0BJT2_9BACT|nr:hypothetical protein [Desulfovibrio subterraneus]GFM34053.1 hypothetical protein DSM101010T_24180 [Desulfovibrio subterraneus]